jgi:hypothetical protein
MPTGGRAAALFSDQHNANIGYGYEVSRIPNDCIEFGGGTHITYTLVNNWNTNGAGSLMSGVAYSDGQAPDHRTSGGRVVDLDLEPAAPGVPL